MILSQRHLSEEDLALFALQLLEPDEQEAALEHLEHCEDCRHDVARFQGDLVGYALAMSEVASPPAQARERLLKRVAKEKKVVPVERVVERPVRAAERPSQPIVPAAPPVAERPMQQVAERLAQRNAAMAPRSSASLPVAAPMNGDGDRGPESRAGLRAAEGELFLASRGRRMFGAEASEDEDAGRDEEPRRMGVVIPFLAITGWAVAACMAITAGLQFRQRQNVQGDLTAMSAKVDRANEVLSDEQAKLDTLTDPSAMQVALHEYQGQALPPSRPEGHVAYMADKGALVFIGDHLTQLPPGKTYELWLLQPDKTKPPVPAGLFKPDMRGVATLVMPELPKGLAAGGFGVTIENEGGSQTPTPPIQLAGM